MSVTSTGQLGFGELAAEPSSSATSWRVGENLRLPRGAPQGAPPGRLASSHVCFGVPLCAAMLVMVIAMTIVMITLMILMAFISIIMLKLRRQRRQISYFPW